MAVITAQTNQSKQKVARNKLKKKEADIKNFATLSTTQKWTVLDDILPALIELLEEQS